MTEEPPPPIRQYTPLRYPGGKGKISTFIKSIVEGSGLSDGQYVEPYAGGAAIALELLLQEYVSEIRINDLSRPIYAFWHSVLNHTEELCRLIGNTKLTVPSWDRQKRIFKDSDNQDLLRLGFATFFLNRTNRSGILNGGIIGGRDQEGPWKIDARYNAPELIRRVHAIANMRGRIHLTQLDALDFLRAGCKQWPKNTLIYLDPPYYVKGKHLYYQYYCHSDHEKVAQFVKTIKRQKWIVSYDDVSEIRKMYMPARWLSYDIGYSAREKTTGSEIMFFGPKLVIPNPASTMRLVSCSGDRAA